MKDKKGLELALIALESLERLRLSQSTKQEVQAAAVARRELLLVLGCKPETVRAC